MKPEEVYNKGTKPENLVRMLGDVPAIQMRPPWDSDLQILKNDLQWYKDEVINLERDINQLEILLHERDEEIEGLQDDMAELQAQLDDQYLNK